MVRLDVTEQHTAHVTLDASNSANALVMLGVGVYPSVFPDKCDPDNKYSTGGKTTVSLSGGEQVVDIPVGLNNWDNFKESGWEAANPLVLMLYIEDADSGNVILDDTEVNGMVQLYKP